MLGKGGISKQIPALWLITSLIELRDITGVKAISVLTVLAMLRSFRPRATWVFGNIDAY